MCKTLDDLMRALLVKQSFWNPQLRSVPRLSSSILWIKTSFRYNKTLELSQPTFVLAFTPGKLFIALKLDLWTLKLRLSRKTRFLANHTFVKRLVVGSVLHNLQTVFVANYSKILIKYHGSTWINLFLSNHHYLVFNEVWLVLFKWSIPVSFLFIFVFSMQIFNSW